MGTPRGTPIDRLIRNVEMIPECGCWISTLRATNHGKYARIKVDGKNILAHRLSWELHSGAIPQGMKVLHTCDTPCCVNPRHLYLGSQSQNMNDMYKKGRGRKGSCNIKLTVDQVVKIRLDGRTYADISRDYGIAPSTVKLIKNRKTWKHVP